MEILFQGLKRAQNVTLSDGDATRGDIKFTTIVTTDFGPSPITIELSPMAMLALIKDFGIEDFVADFRKLDITKILTDANKLKIINIIRKKVVSLSIK